ncbi:MAG: ABC transporter ATP-binding protein [Alphaproteobacteria bacterium]
MTEAKPGTSSKQGTLIEVKGLRHYFELSIPLVARVLAPGMRRAVRAVEDVSFSIPRGTTFSLVGESGSGKSTIARLIVGLYPPSAGSIRFDGVEIAARRARAQHPEVQARMQMIFQDPYASLNPRWRVGDIIAEPIRFRKLLAGRAVGERVAELLRQVGLSPTDADRFPHEFSGGQRQRISIARALAGEPEFLVCDEPTSALDVSVQAQILNLMRDLQRRLGLTYLFISHNLAVVYHVSDAIGVLYLGRLVEVADTRALFRTPQHPYTRMLLDAIPDLALSGRQRTPVAGEVPSPIAPPPGCAFHPRCPFANERCRREVPVLKQISGTLVACHAADEGRLPAWQSALHPGGMV